MVTTMTTHTFSRLLRLAAVAAASALTLGLAACSTTDIGSAPALPANARWAVLPFANHTETPQAGLRAEAISETILRTNGLDSLEPLITDPEILVNVTQDILACVTAGACVRVRARRVAEALARN